MSSPDSNAPLLMFCHQQQALPTEKANVAANEKRCYIMTSYCH